MSIFKDKVLLIIGGMECFSNALLSRFPCTDIGEILVFSRDKEKQDVRYGFHSSRLEM